MKADFLLPCVDRRRTETKIVGTGILHPVGIRIRSRTSRKDTDVNQEALSTCHIFTTSPLYASTILIRRTAQKGVVIDARKDQKATEVGGYVVGCEEKIVGR